MQQSEEKVRQRLLLAAVPEVGQEKEKQIVSVFLHATLPTQGRAEDLQTGPLWNREVAVGC